MTEYKPYKMKGHTLPGINQKSEGNTDVPDGRSGSSPFQHTADPHTTHTKVSDPDNVIKINRSIRNAETKVKNWGKRGHVSGDTEGAIAKEQKSIDRLNKTLAHIQYYKKDKASPAQKKSPTKWVQAVAALAPVVMDMMKKKKEDSPTKDRQSRLEKKQKRHKEKYIEEGAKRGDVNVSKYMKHKRKYKKTSKKLGHGGEYTGGRSSIYIKERSPQKP